MLTLLVSVTFFCLHLTSRLPLSSGFSSSGLVSPLGRPGCRCSVEEGPAGRHETTRGTRGRTGANLLRRQGKRTVLAASPTKADEFAEVEKSVLEYGRKSRKPSSSTIFCNRELNMNSLTCIGFDMDYTLAEYVVPSFDLLAFNGAVDKLIAMGYPGDLKDFKYDPSDYTRGLLIDISRGNFIKIDRHKYVRQARHGTEPMSSQTRKVVYHNTFNKVDSFNGRGYVPMDTLFQFVDASLYGQLVTLKDETNDEFLDSKTYEELYRDIRSSVDLCHRDGVIKDEVARNPGKYIKKDKGTVRMLKRMKREGKKVFLLTNSLWEYTQTVMNYLVEESDTDTGDWTDLFEVVIVGSAKPKFLIDPYQQLFRVNRSDGTLENTDGVYDIAALGENGAKKFLDKGKVFQGGKQPRGGGGVVLAMALQ